MSLTNSSPDYDYFFKIIFVGDYKVGKSSIILRYSDDTFTNSLPGNLGVDFRIRTIHVDDDIVKLQIWDSERPTRHERFFGSYYRGTKCIIAVYDITNLESFEGVKKWQGDIERYAHERVTKVLLGNKCDIEHERKVSFQQGEQYAQQNNMLFFECSAKEGINIEESFNALARTVRDRTVEDHPPTSTNNIIPPKKNQTCIIS